MTWARPALPVLCCMPGKAPDACSCGMAMVQGVHVHQTTGSHNTSAFPCLHDSLWPHWPLATHYKLLRWAQAFFRMPSCP